jgi:hypothetical protein
MGLNEMIQPNPMCAVMLKWNLAALYLSAGALLLVLGFARLPKRNGDPLAHM